MPNLKGSGNTLLCSRFVYGKRISTRAKSVNGENRHRQGLLLPEPDFDQAPNEMGSNPRPAFSHL
jgi:hypothetical protein